MQKAPAGHPVQISSAVPAPALGVPLVLLRAQIVPRVEIALRASIVAAQERPAAAEVSAEPAAVPASPAAAVFKTAEALAKIVHRVPPAAASGLKNRFPASHFRIVHLVPAKRPSVRVSAPQRARAHRDSAHRGLAHRDRGKAVPTVPSASPKAIVPQADHAALRVVQRQVVQADQVVQEVSAARHVATVSRARLGPVHRAGHPAAANHDRRAIAPSSAPILRAVIVRPGADQQAATESPPATVARASSHRGHGLTRAPLRDQTPASEKRDPSAPQASVPVVPVASASQQAGRAAGSQPSANAPSANPASANRAAIANHQANGLKVIAPRAPARIARIAPAPIGPAPIARTVRAPRVQNARVRHAPHSVPVHANPVASANPAPRGNPSVARAPEAQAPVPEAQAPVDLVPQERAAAVPQEVERIAPPPRQVPVSRGVPAALAKRAPEPPAARPPKVASSLVRNAPAAPVRPSANRAAKETKARWPQVSRAQASRSSWPP